MTSSDKGTYFRFFDTRSGKQTKEVTRGTEHTNISSLAFNSSCKYAAVASTKPKIHIFKVENEGAPASSYYNPLAYVNKYCASEGSFANFVQNDKDSGLNQTFIAFTGNKMHVLSKQGRY